MFVLGFIFCEVFVSFKTDFVHMTTDNTLKRSVFVGKSHVQSFLRLLIKGIPPTDVVNPSSCQHIDQGQVPWLAELQSVLS